LARFLPFELASLFRDCFPAGLPRLFYPLFSRSKIRPHPCQPFLFSTGEAQTPCPSPSQLVERACPLPSYGCPPHIRGFSTTIRCFDFRSGFTFPSPPRPYTQLILAPPLVISLFASLYASPIRHPWLAGRIPPPFTPAYAETWVLFFSLYFMTPTRN